MRLLAVLGCVAIASSAAAHHSRSNFADTSVAIYGELTRVDWRNPHVYFFVRSAGEGVEWTIEAQSTPSMLRRGWTPNSLAPGDRITVRGNPDRNPARRFILADVITKTDGTTLPVQGGFDRAGAGRGASARTLAGVWIAVGAPFDRSRPATHLPLTEKAKAAAAKFDVRNDPFADCIPPQVPDSLSTPYLHEIVIKDNVVLLREEYWEVDRVVYMDGRGHPTNAPRTNQGHSIGRWEGTVLVVDTTLFEDHGYGNGSGIPSGARKHMVERYSLTDGGTTVTIDYVLEDPDYLTGPVRGSRQWRYTPELKFLPNRCDLANAQRYVKETAN